MTVFDDLKEKFFVLPVDDLGDCIAIPGEELDLDWILMFLEEGYRFEGCLIDGYPFVLVQIKPIVIDRPTETLSTREGDFN
jgi:hypothetical protein